MLELAARAGDMGLDAAEGVLAHSVFVWAIGAVDSTPAFVSAEHCMARIAKDLPYLVRDHAIDFVLLSPDQLLALFDRDDLNTEGNEYLLWLILKPMVNRYRDESIDDEEKHEIGLHLRGLLDRIRFSLFTLDQLSHFKSQTDVVKLLPDGYLLQVYSYHQEVQQRPFTTPAIEKFLPRSYISAMSGPEHAVIGEIITGLIGQSFLWRLHCVRSQLFEPVTRQFKSEGRSKAEVRSPSISINGTKRCPNVSTVLKCK